MGVSSELFWNLWRGLASWRPGRPRQNRQGLHIHSELCVISIFFALDFGQLARITMRKVDFSSMTRMWLSYEMETEFISVK